MDLFTSDHDMTDHDDDTSVVINGTTVDYGEHPPMVAKALLREARDEPEPSDTNANPEA